MLIGAGIRVLNFQGAVCLQDGEVAKPVLVDLNAASEEEFIRVPGIGKVFAKRIIAYRIENQGFKEVNELVRVKGFSMKKIEKIREYLVCNQVKE